MNGEIYSIFHLSLEPSKFPQLEILIHNVVAETAKEPDTLAYEYTVNADKTVVHIIERYRTQGLISHVEKTFAPFAEEFLSLVTIEKLYVHGDTTPEIRAILDQFGAIYLTSVDGFSR